MKKQRFTLIELLTVIAIIAVLMGLLLPVLGKIKEQGKKVKAKAQMKTLELAIKSYEATYGVLPNLYAEATSNATSDGLLTPDHYNTLLMVLTQVNIGTPLAADSKSRGNNRSIPFFDAPAKFATEGYIDPWGNKYQVILDFSYANQITVDATTTVYGTTAIYSYGPDGKSTTAAEKKDDIKSWE